MRDTTLEVAMLAYVSGAYSAISSVYQCVTGPLWHEHSSLPLDEQNDNGARLEILTICCGLRFRVSIINCYDIL